MGGEVAKYLRRKNMYSLICKTCGEESEPVALQHPISDDNTLFQFAKIGWEVTRSAAWCPNCKVMPR